jgi:type II secretory pathway predicted ATPase ExeA
MYYAFFGLKQPPFRITPDTDFFFEGGNRGAILEALIYAIAQGEGIVKVTGEVGSGKTMLCRVLQARLPANVETVYLANPSVSPEEILHAIGFELQLPLPRDAGRLEVMHALNEFLLAKHAEGRQVVLFVEESQSMPIATLEEIRLLSNLETRQHKLLQIVLFGQPELDDNLRKREIRQLRERITHSFALSPLSVEDVHNYLGFRLRAAGYAGPDLFPRRVIQYLTRATAGLTRRINIVADKALLAAFAENTHNVTLRHAKLAVEDSEFSDPVPRAGRRRNRTVWAAALAGGLAVAVAVVAYEHFGPRSLGTGSGSAAFKLQAYPTTGGTGPGVDSRIDLADADARAEPAPAMAPTDGRPGSSSVVASAGSDPVSPGRADALVEGTVGTLDMAGGRAQPSAPTYDLLEQRLLATDRWLAKAHGGMFSIQLLGSNDPRMLQRYLQILSKYIEIDKIFVYRTSADEEPSMTVLYGAFAARGDALRSLDELPAELKANHPYIRTVQGVRSELGLNKPS